MRTGLAEACGAQLRSRTGESIPRRGKTNSVLNLIAIRPILMTGVQSLTACQPFYRPYNHALGDGLHQRPLRRFVSGQARTSRGQTEQRIMIETNKVVILTKSRSRESKGGEYEKNSQAGLPKIAASIALVFDYCATG
jgi:hypothetical protein